MPFGRYKGVSLQALPNDYLDWLMTIDLHGWLEAAVEDEWNRRAAPPPQAEPALPPLDNEAAKCAEELIRKGFQQAAKVRHPDVGGSHEAMIELNCAVAWLLTALAHRRP